MENMKCVGNKIQLARLNKSFTQEKLAELCDVSTKHISALETGSSKGSISLMINICKHLSVTPNYLFENALDLGELESNIEVITSESLITYSKLKPENKNFILDIIDHLYKMQNLR